MSRLSTEDLISLLLSLQESEELLNCDSTFFKEDIKKLVNKFLFVAEEKNLDSAKATLKEVAVDDSVDNSGIVKDVAKDIATSSVKQKSSNSKKDTINTTATKSSTNKVNLGYSLNELDKIDNLTDFYEFVNSVDCPLKAECTNTVLYDGNSDSRIMIIGEAPGKTEDQEGIPFCGKSGALLENIMKDFDLNRPNDYYITNIVFWRPPLNRTPNKSELATCLPLTEKHIALVKPEIILLIGSTAASILLNNQGESFSSIMGRQISYRNKYMEYDALAMPLFHPSFLFRQPYCKKDMWQAICSIPNLHV